MRGRDAGSWAQYSIVERLPEIGRRTLAEADFPPEVEDRLNDLIDQIPHGKMQPIDDPQAPDIQAWNRYLEPHLADSWLTAPWFFVETYFYRRIIADSGYFHQPVGERLDPFAAQKEQALASSVRLVAERPADPPLADVLMACLWANQADLSLWPHGGNAGNGESPSAADERLLIDQREPIVNQLMPGGGPVRLDLVLDNVGAELAADLLLAEALLGADDRTVVRLHAKLHPTFVSDATITDVRRTLSHWRASREPAAESAAERLQGALDANRLLVEAHPFWTSPLAGWHMPSDLRATLASADLILFKGDANYRRLLGDRHWPFTTPFDSIVDYLPAPGGVLRSLKADVAAGLDRPTIERTAARDPQWMIDGRWALIQVTESRG